MRAERTRETGDTEHTGAPSMLSGHKVGVLSVVGDDEYKDVKSNGMKKAASKDVQKSVVDEVKSVGRAGPEYAHAAHVRESVQRRLESDNCCQDEGSRIQGDAKDVMGDSEVSEMKKSRNLVDFGRVRRPGLSLQSRIHIFEQAKRGGMTSFDADSGST